MSKTHDVEQLGLKLEGVVFYSRFSSTKFFPASLRFSSTPSGVLRSHLWVLTLGLRSYTGLRFHPGPLLPWHSVFTHSVKLRCSGFRSHIPGILLSFAPFSSVPGTPFSIISLCRNMYPAALACPGWSSILKIKQRQHKLAITFTTTNGYKPSEIKLRLVLLCFINLSRFPVCTRLGSLSSLCQVLQSFQSIYSVLTRGPSITDSKSPCSPRSGLRQNG